MDNLSLLPIGFWISLSVLAIVARNCWRHRREGWGIPGVAVCGTVCAWYHGDAIYNGYKYFTLQFSPEVQAAAWWQVTWFLAAFALLAPFVHRKCNAAMLHSSSVVLAIISAPNVISKLQRPLKAVFAALATVWFLLTAIALVRTHFDIRGLFAPWLGHLASPWARGRIGSGLDFFWSLCGYVDMFCLAGIGIVAALASSLQLFISALTLVVLSWPEVLFDRTRGSILVVVLPAVFCVVFVRLRGSRAAQIGFLLGGFLAIGTWFAFVMANRSSESIAAAFAQGKLSDRGAKKQEGLNMLEELCWINKFMDDGTYVPNWGRRYFADAVNIIPRTLWPGKPTIGLDYAVARGQGMGTSGEQVGATISTGMIGQGVVNFGPWGGPPAAALLMAIWVAVLARYDLTGNRFGRLPLYLLGLVLTFNLGRDITFLVAFPLVFGYALIRLAEAWRGSPKDAFIVSAAALSTAKTDRSIARSSQHSRSQPSSK